jgi:hypothetical protein
MPKVIPVEELQRIVEIVAPHRDGVGVDAIRRGLGPGLSDRTLQRRLSLLSREGRITAEGTGKGRRYFPVRPPEPVEIGETPRARIGTSLRLSTEGEAIKQSVIRPVAERHPVGYHAEFLEAYEPNRTAYIPQVLRDDLARMGRVGQDSMPAGTYLRQVMGRLLIDLSWNSSRLEGNTYSLLETQRLLELGEAAEGKAAEETQMILNHKEAIELLAESSSQIGFNRYTICNLHAILAENLLPSPEAEGHVRTRPVGITGTVFEPLGVPQLIEEHLDLILGKADQINDPFEQAFFMLVHLPYLQPFEDVNKRVSRLAANIPFVRHNLCPLSFVDVNQDDYVRATLGVYELNRVEYLRDVFAWAYGRSCARYSAIRGTLGEPDPFRLRHRQCLRDVIAQVVRQGHSKTVAVRYIRDYAASHLPEDDRSRFLEVAETELMALHEGNIARYRLRPSEFSAWQDSWRR